MTDLKTFKSSLRDIISHFDSVDECADYISDTLNELETEMREEKELAQAKADTKTDLVCDLEYYFEELCGYQTKSDFFYENMLDTIERALKNSKDSSVRYSFFSF